MGNIKTKHSINSFRLIVLHRHSDIPNKSGALPDYKHWAKHESRYKADGIMPIPAYTQAAVIVGRALMIKGRRRRVIGYGAVISPLATQELEREALAPPIWRTSKQCKVCSKREVEVARALTLPHDGDYRRDECILMATCRECLVTIDNARGTLLAPAEQVRELAGVEDDAG